MDEGVRARIDSLAGDWRGALLARLRTLILAVDPAIEEAVKWRKPSNPLGVPTWSLAGILCTGEVYRDKVKLTFPNGAALPDPHRLFNAGQTGVRRAIDLGEGAVLDEAALAELIAAAIAENLAPQK
jgi:hypothetical protein